MGHRPNSPCELRACMTEWLRAMTSSCGNKVQWPPDVPCASNNELLATCCGAWGSVKPSACPGTCAGPSPRSTLDRRKQLRQSVEGGQPRILLLQHLNGALLSEYSASTKKSRTISAKAHVRCSNSETSEITLGCRHSGPNCTGKS